MNNEKEIQIKPCTCGGYTLCLDFIHMHLSQLQCTQLSQQLRMALRYPQQHGRDIERGVLNKKGWLN